MPEPDLIELFAQPLNQVDIRYLISGSVAAMLYGEPRVTHVTLTLWCFSVPKRLRGCPRFSRRRNSTFRRWLSFLRKWPGNGAGISTSFTPIPD